MTSVAKNKHSSAKTGLVIRALFCLVICIFVSACSETETDSPLYFSGPTMGTTYNITVVDTDLEESPEVIASKIMALLARVNQIASTYIPESELMIFNGYPVGEAFTLSPELLEMLIISEKTYHLTDGAFDVTVGPVVNLWGFGPVDQREIPNDTKIENALETVGFHNIQLIPNESSAVRNSDVFVDLSSVAKGYAVDAVADYIESIGGNNFLVEIGGEISVKGLNSRGTDWKIGIEAPTLGRIDPLQAINVTDLAIATSGDYRNFFDVDGVRYSHTIDPRTGRPITHHLASITLLHESSAYADTLTTGLNVLGYDIAIDICNENGWPCYFVVREGNQFKEYPSKSFVQYMNE
jgi:thiamine biosynthesis lipoprotein